MAKKLPKDDLERIKSDFDAPRVDPGQTVLFDNDGNIPTGYILAEGKRAGRRRVHTEPGRTFSVWLEDDLIHRLKRAALEQNISAASFARAAINAALQN